MRILSVTLLSVILCVSAFAQRQTVRTLNRTNYASQFNWKVFPSAPSTLSAGANTVTLAPCPIGIGVASPYTVSIATTGTPEVVTVTSGSCTRGASSGTIVFTAANSHTAGYTIGSASFGLQEAINDAVSASGTNVIIDSAWGGTTVGAAIYGSTAISLHDIRGGFAVYSWNGSAYTTTLPPPYLLTNGSPGTSLNQTVQLDASGHATIGAASSTNIIGGCVAGCGTTGSASIAYAGLIPFIFTNATTVIGDYASPSATPGEVDDVGASEIPGRQTLGQITTVNSGVGTIAIVNFYPRKTSQGQISNCGTVPAIDYQSAIGQIIVCDPNATLDGNGNLGVVTVTVAPGSSTVAVYTLRIGSVPASPATNYQLFYMDSTSTAFTCLLHAGTKCPLAAGWLNLDEIAAPSGIASVDVLYGDATAHRPKVRNNNGSATTLALFTDNLGVFASGGTVTPDLYAATTFCSAIGTGANPSLVACSAAPAGAFSCATNASTGTCVISTTAVTANSQIFLQEDASLGSLLGVTCNTASITPTNAPVSARSAGASFTINLGTVSTHPECFSYLIVN